MMRIPPLLLATVALTVVSCSTTKKKSTSSGVAGMRNFLTVAQPVPKETIDSLKTIANDPASLLPPAEKTEKEITAISANSLTMTNQGGAQVTTRNLLEDWKGPGINPGEINPGDLFFENAGPLLHKTLSLVDELNKTERRALLDHFTEISTTRVPLTISKSELDEMKKTTPEALPLPTRSVTLDFRSETRTLRGAPYLTLLKALERGDSGGAVEFAKRRANLKAQIIAVKKQLRAGERLFVVTSVMETEKLRATSPGAPLESRDTSLIRNAIAGLYPHLTHLEAVRLEDTVELTAPPRILWEFDTREIKLRGDELVIDFESVVKI